MEELLSEILADLKAEIGISADDTNKTAILSSKIKSAIREVRLKRNYPSHFTDAQIVNDLNTHYSVIREVSLYDYNQVGAEGETSHNGNGTSRTWKSRNECFNGVVSYCR